MNIGIWTAHVLTCKPTVILKRAMSFFPALREMGLSNAKVEFSPFPDALTVQWNHEVELIPLQILKKKLMFINMMQFSAVMDTDEKKS